MLNGHGDDGYLTGCDIKANFSTNVWHHGVSEKLVAHLQQQLGNVNSYPEVCAESLSEAIAKKNVLNKEQVLITNGATEAFYLLAQLFEKCSSLIFYPSFAEYEDACRLFKHELKFEARSNIFEAEITGHNIIWICNPNNPDGKYIPKEKLIQKITENPHIVFIVDEAYIDFVRDSESLLKAINLFPNLVVVKSMTKHYAIPGLRLGYIAASEEIVNKLKAIKQPWSVNSLAIQAGNYILNNENLFRLNLRTEHSEKARFVSELNKIEWIKVSESDTTYFLGHLLKPLSSELKDFLVKEHGLLIRDAANFRGLDKHAVRIATLSKEKNDLLINALNKWSLDYL